MRLSALLLAATAGAAVFTAASAQTNTTTTTSSSTTQTAPMSSGQTASPPPASMGSPPVQDGGATPAPGAAMTPVSGGAFRTITPAPGADIVSVLQASGQFTTLLKIADATNLTATLKGPNITLLAPTDTAFSALPPSALDLKDQANLQSLQALLAYHVIATKLPPLKGHSATAVQTGAAGKKVTLDGSGDAVKINDATALQSGVTASNGVIYPIDKVLSPDYVAPAAAAPAATDDTATTKSTTTTKKSSKKKR